MLVVTRYWQLQPSTYMYNISIKMYTIFEISIVADFWVLWHTTIFTFRTFCPTFSFFFYYKWHVLLFSCIFLLLLFYHFVYLFLWFTSTFYSIQITDSGKLSKLQQTTTLFRIRIVQKTIDRKYNVLKSIRNNISPKDGFPETNGTTLSYKLCK